jgi:DtxR family Mn-dependent transcriptional regulator
MITNGFISMTYSTSKENYLKAIYHLQTGTNMVSTNDLARELQTRPASVTDMLKKLRDQGLLIYEKYRGFRLSEQGEKVALQIIRKHRLWEFFLVEKLHFGWEEVHEVAEELEHIRSKKLIDRLDAYLGHPKSDPHGDPIPDSEGNFAEREDIRLPDLKENQSALVSNISNQDPAMLELLKHKNISLGTKITLKKKFDFDQSVEVVIEGHPAINLSEQVACHIFVQIP